MSSTQELSQWMLERNEPNNSEPVLNFTPGQSGYVAFEDLDLGVTQQQTQVEITPQVATRSEIYPENKRFIEPETPVPGRRINNGGISSESNEFQTPSLPALPFGNPFGPCHGEGNDGMGLTQVFKATQAASSPNLVRRRQLPSSQRPSPNALARNILEYQSDLIYEPDLGIADLKEITYIAQPSSPISSAHIEPTSSDSRKRALEEVDESLSEMSDGSGEQGNRKRSRTSLGRELRKTGEGQNESPKPVRSTKRGNTQQALDTVVIEDDVNSTEDETEHEDEADDGDSHRDENEGEADKENRVVHQEMVPRPGLQIKRASKMITNQAIPLSSSPAVARHQAQIKPGDVTVADDHEHSFSQHQVQDSSAHEIGQQVTIVDSQSSQKPDPKLISNGLHSQIGSSNDSRKVIPQSQAPRPPSLLHVTTTQNLTSLNSQQPVSPPYSGSGKRRNSDRTVLQSHGQELPDGNCGLPVSPRSSPPLLKEGHELIRDVLDQEADNIEAEADRNPTETAVVSSGSEARNSTTLVGRTPATRSTRPASSIPETRYIKRCNDIYAVGAPTSKRNPFSMAENIEFSFSGLSQPDKNLAPAARSLNNAFGSHLIEDVLNSPVRKSPAKPRTFSSIDINDIQSQEQDSIELATWSTQDRAICEDIHQYPGSGSSPLAVGRKRRRGNNRKPILLDEVSVGDISAVHSEESIIQQGEVLHNEGSCGTANNVSTQTEGQPDIQAQIKSPIRKENEEVIPFMDLRIPMKRYGNKAKQLKRKRERPSTAPVETTTITFAAPRKRGRPRKNPISQTSSTAMTHKSLQSSTARSSRRSTIATTFATTRTQQSILTDLVTVQTSFDTIRLPNRVFARFQGSYSGYFPATCLACFETEMEKKYKVRFDDGTTDLIGIRFIKRLELRIGEEVKVDRERLGASSFIVMGFGSELDTEELSRTEHPITDVHGHETVKLVEKGSAQNKKNLKSTQEIEIPITEVFFTAGLWSAIRDRDYSHTVINVDSTHTPLVFKTTSTFRSPSSRTRSTNKLNLTGVISTETVSLDVANQSWPVAESGIFNDVVFVFTSVDIYERKKLVETVGRQGGVTVEDFQELFDLPEAQMLCDQDDGKAKEENGDTTRKDCGISLKSRFAKTKLAVLVTPTDNRNTKYFQALALGIPCLSQHWIKDCLQSGKLKSWRPYLLAAGSSVHLGTTISRQLNLTHKEIEDPNTNLAKIIDRREQWLEGGRLLLVGSEENGSMTRLHAHMFIALVLGASQVVLAKNVSDVNQCMATGRHTFEWICVDNEREKEKGNINKNEKRAKRHSSTVMESLKLQKGMERTKVVGAQLVLQSLIVGTLLDWDELGQERSD